LSTSTRLRLPRCKFMKTVVKSGLLAPDDLIGVFAQYDPEQIEAAEPLQIATILVRKKLLTKFQAMQLLQGKTQGFVLGNYKITQGVREDRVGLVFLAEDAESGTLVSVKVLPTDRVSDDTVYRPFLNEARAARAVTHESVARVLDLGIWRDTHYVVTEHVPAPTLDKIVAENGPLSPNGAAQVIAQVAVGLMHAHAKGLMHRDIKPANIALFPNRKVKLLDLGLTHMLDNPWAKLTKRINLKEYAEEIAHIPPEQAWGCELDARSDIYSLGSTAFLLITGKNPFPGTATQMMTDRQVYDIPKPSTLRAGIPAELDEIVRKMGAKDPHNRYQSVKDLVIALHPWLPVSEWSVLSTQLIPKPSEKPAPPHPPGLFARIAGAFGSLFSKKK
jgi:eukaryotic-like serine/threonine-protein kinase